MIWLADLKSLFEIQRQDRTESTTLFTNFLFIKELFYTTRLEYRIWESSDSVTVSAAERITPNLINKTCREIDFRLDHVSSHIKLY